MAEINNINRVSWAMTGLCRYSEAKEGRAMYDPPADMAADMIADLLHLIRAEGGDPDAAIRMAQSNFEAEKEEQNGK